MLTQVSAHKWQLLIILVAKDTWMLTIFTKTTHWTVKEMYVSITGIFKPCKACSLGKAKMLMLLKTCEKSKVTGEWLFMDIAFPTAVSLHGKKYWLLIVDDCSYHTWIYFLGKLWFTGSSQWFDEITEGKIWYSSYKD